MAPNIAVAVLGTDTTGPFAVPIGGMGFSIAVATGNIEGRYCLAVFT